MTNELKCVLLDIPNVVGRPPALHRHRRAPQTSNPSGKCSCNDAAQRKKNKSTFGSKTISQRLRKHKHSQSLVDAGVELPNLQATRRREHLQVSVWIKNYWFSSLSSLNKRVLTLESIWKLRKLNTEHNRLCRKWSLKIFARMQYWKVWSSLALDLLAH